MMPLLRAALLLCGLLLTMATSVRNPHYPAPPDGHSGTVYLHNGSLRSVTAHVAGLAAGKSIDCDRVLAGSAEAVSPRAFVPREEWIVRSGENLPLWRAQPDGDDRSCHAVLVRLEHRTWLVAWREGAPAVHVFPHASAPGTPPTDGGLRAMSNGAAWMLAPPAGVVVTELNPRKHRALVIESTPARAPGHLAMSSYATGAAIADDNVVGDSTFVWAFGLRMRNVLGRGVGAVVGSDFEVGGTDTGGVAYNLNVQALGLGVGGTGVMAGVVVGGGLSGITGDRLGFGLQVPVEAFAAVDVSRRVRLGAWVRSQWVFAEDARQDGAANAPFGDELHAGVSVDWLRVDRYHTARPGLSLMFTYSEVLGTEMYGLAIGGAVHDEVVAD